MGAKCAKNILHSAKKETAVTTITLQVEWVSFAKFPICFAENKICQARRDTGVKCCSLAWYACELD
jgi:hypothetical protein